MRIPTIILPLFIVTTTFAEPLSLGEIIGNPELTDLYGIYDFGAEYASLASGADHVQISMLVEKAGYSDENSCGLFGFNMDANGGMVMGNTLNIIAGDKWLDAELGIGRSVTIDFDLATGITTNLMTKESANIGPMFGFYIASPEGTFYSHTAFNPDGVDHFLMYDVTGNRYDPSLTAVIGMEDLFTDGVPGPMGPDDLNYTDLVIGMSNTRLVAAPEPSSLNYMTFTLIGCMCVLGYRRSRIKYRALQKA
jgi:hypothetical protein